MVARLWDVYLAVDDPALVFLLLASLLIRNRCGNPLRYLWSYSPNLTFLSVFLSQFFFLFRNFHRDNNALKAHPRSLLFGVCGIWNASLASPAQTVNFRVTLHGEPYEDFVLFWKKLAVHNRIFQDGQMRREYNKQQYCFPEAVRFGAFKLWSSFPLDLHVLLPYLRELINILLPRDEECYLMRSSHSGCRYMVAGVLFCSVLVW